MGAAASTIATSPTGSAALASAAEVRTSSQSHRSFDLEGPLTPFPPELIDCILPYLDWRDVLSLLRVNSVFYRSIGWRMVNRVRILERNGMLELEAQHTEPRLFLTPSMVAKWLPDFVEQVDMYAHAVCVVKEGHSWPLGTHAVYEQHVGASFRPLLPTQMSGRLDLPNFRTLRLFFSPTEGVMHTDMPPYEAHALRCRLLPPRRPDTIVLRFVPAKALKHLHTLLPWEYVTRLRRQVLVIGPELVGELGTVNGTIYLNWWDQGRALDTLESCEVVFCPPDHGEWLPIPASRAEEWSHGLLQRWFDRMLRTLQMSFIELAGAPGPGPDVGMGSPQPRNVRVPKLTIINAGAITPACYAAPADATRPGKYASYAARQMAVEDAFDAIWNATLPPSLAGRRTQLAQRVRFVSLEEWVQEGRWRGVFDPDEVGL